MTKLAHNPIYQNKFKKCLEWLNNYLVEPHTAEETKDEAHFLGFDLDTLYRAKRTLGIKILWTRSSIAPITPPTVKSSAAELFGEPEIEPSPRASQPGE